MKQNFSKPTWNHFLEFGIKSVKLTMELLRSIRRHVSVQKDLGLLNSGMLNRGEVLGIIVAVDQLRVKIGGNNEKLTVQKLNEIAE